MIIAIAHMKLNGGTEAVVRGTSWEVQEGFEYGRNKAGGGEILYQVEENIDTSKEEDLLWQRFVEEADKFGHGDFARKKQVIWRRKAYGIWSSQMYQFGLCMYMANHDGMIWQVKRTNVRVINPSSN